MASLGPRGLIGRIYAGDHYTLLPTKYISCGHGFREEDFLTFSHYKSMGVHNPMGRGQFGPQGLDWQDVCRDYLTLLHTKYISCGPHVFRDEDFLSFSYYKSIGANDA